MQEKYWKYMVQIKAWIFYLDVYTEDSYRWDRIINIVVAIASSTSIAAWAIWQKYSFVWSIIIAISQVLTTIKGFLPYSKRLKMLVPFMDAYILGVNEPVKKFTGKIIAIVRRKDDIEEKWVVVPDGVTFSKEEIRRQIHFQEQYFDSEIVM